jgi:hypothetical protein
MWIVLFIIALALITTIGRWKTYEKAGYPGYHAIIPFLADYVWLKMGDLSGWWAWFFVLFVYYARSIYKAQYYFGPTISMTVGLLLLIVELVLHAVISFRVAKKFDYNYAFGIGLFLFYPIFIMILGFEDHEYRGEKPDYYI